MAGIYIHIPFCTTKCSYCDFYSRPQTELKEEVLDAISREMGTERGFIGEAQIDSIYFGGGTPSLLSASQIQSMIDKVRSLWFCGTDMEITVEANPDDLTPDYVEMLAETEINRISIGIQSFIDRDLRFLNRRHGADQARASVCEVKKAGFHNITIDLMYGLPGMNICEWEENIESAVSLDVQHISAYHLTIEEDTVLGKKVRSGEVVPVDEETSEKQFGALHRMLTDAGYEHYEVSNFARPGFRAVHNTGYWKGMSYLGLGPSAHSYNGRVRRECIRDIRKYIDRQSLPDIYTKEELTVTDLYNEYIMTALRCSDGVDTAVLEGKFGKEHLKRFEKTARKYIELGLLTEMDGIYSIPAEKFFVSDGIISDFFN